MKKIIAVTVLCLFLAGCSITITTETTPETTGALTTAAPTTAAPTTAAPTTEALPEEYTGPAGYHHSALPGTWKRTGSEVEGDVNDGGDCTLVITATGDGSYLATYTDHSFPDSSYSDRAVRVEDGAIYEGCGNDRWLAVVDYALAPNGGTMLTIRDDGTLLIQNSFFVDGIPMVSYEFFERIS